MNEFATIARKTGAYPMLGITECSALLVSMLHSSIQMIGLNLNIFSISLTQ